MAFDVGHVEKYQGGSGGRRRGKAWVRAFVWFLREGMGEAARQVWDWLV